MTGFDEGIERGTSFELANALAALTHGADEADVSVEFFPSEHMPTDVTGHTFTFTGSDSTTFNDVANRLATVDTRPRITVVGRVHLLSKKDASSSGVIGITTFGTGVPKRVRVHLVQPVDYHEAVWAHDEGRLTEVSGDLQAKETMNWRCDAYVDEVLEPIEPAHDGPQEEELFRDDQQT